MAISPKKKRAVVAAAIILAIGLAAAAPMWMPKTVVEYYVTGFGYSIGMFDYNPYGPVYTETMPQNYTHFNVNTPLTVAPHWINSGNLDASLELTLTATNANITWFSKFGDINHTVPQWVNVADGQNCNQTTLTFTSHPKGQSQLLYEYIDVMPVANAQNFTVTFSIKDMASGYTSLIAHGPTTFTYVMVDSSTNAYRLET